MNKVVNLISRILMAQIFLIAGIGKISAYAGTQHYMAAYGLPGTLLPLVILLEVGGGLALLLGFQTRIAAWALALFSIAAALIFHTHFAEQMQQINFMKNLVMAGGLMLLATYGADAWSLDALRKRH